MPRHPSDLASVITGDRCLVETLLQRIERNEGNRRVLLDQLVFHLSAQARARQLVIQPAIRQAFDETIDEQRQITAAVAVLDDPDSDFAEQETALSELRKEFDGHTEEDEEKLLNRLREAVGDEGMARLGSATRSIELADRSRQAAADASGLLNLQAQTVTDRLADLGIKPIHLLQPNQARRQPTATDAVFSLLAQTNSEEPEDVSTIEEVQIPVTDGDITLRLYRPRDAAGNAVVPAVIYAHGGGWLIGDLDAYDPSARALANGVGAAVISIEYRHAPEHPFPTAHEDVLAATKWVFANASRIQVDPSSIAIAGESVGANMAIAASVALAIEGHALPVAQALVYPVASTAMDTTSYDEARDAKPLCSAMMSAFFGHAITEADQLDDPRLNTLATPHHQLAPLPPTIVVTAERDPLRDEGEMLADLLQRCGVDTACRRFEGVPHEFFGWAPILEEAKQAQLFVSDFLRNAMKI
jgi:acetyl esterase